jgi:hypothetical protein
LILNGEKIRSVLATADQLALSGQIDKNSEFVKTWATYINKLSTPDMPKTYLAVFGVLLAARSLEDEGNLDVRHIQAGSSPIGYSAPSIGKALATFVKEQGIDLRATSTQPLNNQPFTYKKRIELEMGVKKNKRGQWGDFYKIVELVNKLSSPDAQTALALLFDMRRTYAKPSAVAHGRHTDLFSTERFMENVCFFVEKNSENGKVGQAFVSSCLELIYGTENVIQGHSQDPDAKLVGDVHVYKNDEPVIFVEVKQAPIATGQIAGFMDKISEAGEDRAIYFALENYKYSGHINLESVRKKAQKLNMTITLYSSPQEAFDALFSQMVCSVSNFIETFSVSFRSRLVEAGVAEGLLDTFGEQISEFVTFTISSVEDAEPLPN